MVLQLGKEYPDRTSVYTALEAKATIQRRASTVTYIASIRDSWYQWTCREPMDRAI